MTKRKQARNKEIIAKRKSGMKLQDLADEYGLTKSRIAQICKIEKTTGVVTYMPDDCPYCGARKEDQRWIWIHRRFTCHDVWQDDPFANFKCSECDKVLHYHDKKRIACCPFCKREVVMRDEVHRGNRMP